MQLMANGVINENYSSFFFFLQSELQDYVYIGQMRYYIMSVIHTIQLIVDNVFQAFKPLEYELSVHQVRNFAIPGSQSLICDSPDRYKFFRAVLNSAVHGE